VIDGDTISVSGLDVGRRDGRTDNRVARLIGVDTPESSGECFARESTAFTRNNLLGRKVFVDFDVEKRDRFGRALVYIWESEGAFFNGRLVAEGFAQQATFPPNVRYVELFSKLVREARESARGLWSRC
jgi:micrococcal nuclease